jgi:ABC-2 type transport system permease protein
MDMGFNIARQTAKDHLKTTLALSLIFVAITVMFASIYPSFKESMELLLENIPEYPIRGFESAASYMGYLNIELYQIFWVLILGLLIGYIAGTVVSKEVESKTMDMLLSNPVPRYRIVLEKYLGMVPLVLAVNFATLATIVAVTLAIGEELLFYHLLMTHVMSLPYFLSVLAMGILVSTVVDDKMKASIVVMGIIIGSYILVTLGLLAPGYENLGLISLTHYYDPAETLLQGNVDIAGSLVLMGIAGGCLVAAIWYFGRRDIRI